MLYFTTLFDTCYLSVQMSKLIKQPDTTSIYSYSAKQTVCLCLNKLYVSNGTRGFNEGTRLDEY